MREVIFNSWLSREGTFSYFLSTGWILVYFPFQKLIPRLRPEAMVVLVPLRFLLFILTVSWPVNIRIWFITKWVERGSDSKRNWPTSFHPRSPIFAMSSHLASKMRELKSSLTWNFWSPNASQLTSFDLACFSSSIRFCRRSNYFGSYSSSNVMKRFVFVS